MSVSLLALTPLCSATLMEICCRIHHIGNCCFLVAVITSTLIIFQNKMSSCCLLFYSYAIIACTSEGCITSFQTNITTLEAPPATVETPTVHSIVSNSMTVSWRKPLTHNGELTEYVLKLNNRDVYRGGDLSVALSDLQPHTSYQLVLLACTSGGCTASATVSTVTEEAPPTGMPAPTLKVVDDSSLLFHCNLYFYIPLFNQSQHLKLVFLFDVLF